MRFLIALVAATVCCQAMAADYLGKVLAVSDGDTFTMETDGGKVRVRICGIDAPERGQAGYGQAAGVLSNMIEGKTVHCVQVGEGTVCDGRSKPTDQSRLGDRRLAAAETPSGAAALSDGRALTFIRLSHIMR